MENCLFCEFTDKKQETIFENDSFIAKFDLFPVTPGHSLIIPKRHVVSFLDLDDEEWANLKPALKEAVSYINTADKKSFYESLMTNYDDVKGKKYWSTMLEHPGIDSEPDAFNFGVNDGLAAGRTIHHFHLHIIPRYKGDVDNPTGGVRSIIPALGNYTKE